MLPSVITAKAAKAGLALIENNSVVEARLGKKVIAFHSDANRALAKALERLEADRIRNLNDDTEPVLKIKPKKTNGHATSIEATIDEGIRQTIADAPPPAPPERPPVEAVIDAGIKQTIIKGSIIKDKYKDRYKKHGMSCGDEISEELRLYLVVLVDGKSRISLERLREVADKNMVWRDRYAQLNVGQQRMNIGNRLRAKYAAGESIDIGGVIWKQEFDV